MSAADVLMLAATADARPAKQVSTSGAATKSGGGAKIKPRVRVADGEEWFAAWAAGGGAAHVMSLVARPAGGDTPLVLLWVGSAASAAKRASATAAGSAVTDRDAASGDDDDIIGPSPDAAASAGVAAAAVALRATSTLLWAAGREAATAATASGTAKGGRDGPLATAVEAAGGAGALLQGCVDVLEALSSACASAPDHGASMGAAPRGWGEAETAASWEGAASDEADDAEQASPWAAEPGAALPGTGSPLASCVAWATIS